MLSKLRERRDLISLVRYLTVGVVSNGLLYAGYVLLTYFGMLPVIATSVLYAVGIAGTYMANRSWSFKSDRGHVQAAPRYLLAYGAGYLVQVATLSGLTYLLGVPHQIAQLAAMVGAAGTIYISLRVWVFPNQA